MPGFRAGKKEDKLGWRASDTCELILEDVEVPIENLLGAEGQGFVNFMKTLDNGRIGINAWTANLLLNRLAWLPIRPGLGAAAQGCENECDK
jgi:butyryl-CoA dehydrogenase